MRASNLPVRALFALAATLGMMGPGSAVEVPRERRAPVVVSTPRRIGNRVALASVNAERFGARRKRRLRNQAARALRGAV